MMVRIDLDVINDADFIVQTEHNVSFIPGSIQGGFCTRLRTGLRPLFILPSLIAVVDQHPEIPSHNIGHFRSTKKTRFSGK